MTLMQDIFLARIRSIATLPPRELLMLENIPNQFDAHAGHVRACGKDARVYFIARPNGDVKIGKTGNLKVRLQTLVKSNPGAELLCSMTGYTTVEEYLHSHYHDFWVGEEWFKMDYWSEDWDISGPPRDFHVLLIQAAQQPPVCRGTPLGRLGEIWWGDRGVELP